MIATLPSLRSGGGTHSIACGKSGPPVLFMIVDENQSHYFSHNIKAHIADPSKVNRLDIVPADPEGNADRALGQGFAISNFKNTISLSTRRGFTDRFIDS